MGGCESRTKAVTKKAYREDNTISILMVSIWDLTACSIQKHQYYHDNAMSTGTTPSTTLSSPSQTEPSGWQILSMSTGAASITKHHICTHFGPKEFGGELLSNLHNLYMLGIIARVRSWALLWKSKSCFSYLWSSRGQAEVCDCYLEADCMGLEQSLWLSMSLTLTCIVGIGI